MMDDILKTALGRAPELAVLVALVVIFVRALKDEREAHARILSEQTTAHTHALSEQRDAARQERREWLDRFMVFHQDHLDARKEARDTTKQVADVMLRLSIAVEAMSKSKL